MEKYYEQLNAKCKEVAKEVIKDNSILSDNMLKREEKEFLLSDWNAFLIGLISDQSVKAEIAWRLPYYLSKRLGHFDFCKIDINIVCMLYILSQHLLLHIIIMPLIILILKKTIGLNS